jgi:hypothetical protein
MEVVKSLLARFGYAPMRVERNRQGVFTYSFLDGGNDFVYNEKYLELSLCNPVLMTIVALRSRLYSQMEIKHVNSKGVVIENSPYVKLLNNPNYFQSKEDFFFQQMWFLSSAGYDYIYQKKAFANELPKAIYNLIPSEIDLNNAHKVNKFIVTEKDKKAFGERKIKYTLDSTTYELMLSDLIPLYDLSNGLTNNSFFQSQSRVRGIRTILNNIDQNIKSKNINLQFSQKYLSKNEANGNEAIIKPEDRNDIERKLDSKNLIITNSAIQVQHLVSDMKKLYLDEQFADDANKCLLAFEMNKNVLNYFSKDSTFDNQENGVISYIQNSIQTNAKNTMNSLSQQWGLMERGEKLIASYDHLAVMQPVVNDKIKSFTEMQNAIKLGLENETLTPTDAKKMSDEFKLKLGL